MKNENLGVFLSCMGGISLGLGVISLDAVSYTHLDVYKRQVVNLVSRYLLDWTLYSIQILSKTNQLNTICIAHSVGAEEGS